jgi:hypothetical protein
MIPDGLRSYALDRFDKVLDRIPLFAVLTVLMVVQMAIADKALSETVRQQLGNLYMGMSVWQITTYYLFVWTVLPLVLVSLRVIIAWFRTGGEPFTDDYWSEYA